MKILLIILSVFVYLLIGVGVLEIMKYHDRHVNSKFDIWIDDEIMEVAVVLFVPISFIWVFFWLIYKGTLAFIRITRIFFTTVIYSVIALIKRRK